MIVYFDKHRGFGSTNQITIDNYKELIIKIGISKLPDSLLKGHQFFSKNKDQYGVSDSITETIKDYLTDLNNYVEALPGKRRKEIFQENKGYSGNRFEGKNYKRTKDLPMRDIAKMVKKELEIKYEEIAKFSVTSDNFTGGSALVVDITDLTFNPYEEKFLAALKAGQTIEAYNQEHRNKWNQYPTRFNERFSEFIEEVKKITNQYNFDDSDSQTDYFHVNYYERVGFNESKYLVKHFPDSPDAIRHIEFNKKWDIQKKKSSITANSKKGKYKKGAVVFLNIDLHSSWHKYKLPNGFYLVLITKSPNGRGFSSSYTVRILEDINVLSPNTIAYHKKSGAEKYYIKNEFGTFYQSSPINAHEVTMFPLDADEKIMAIQKAKIEAVKILRNK